MKFGEIESIIEAILFVSGEPISVEKISHTLNLDYKTTKKVIRNFADKLEIEKRGLIIIEVEGSYQMCTNPIYHDYIKNIYQTSQKRKLTQTLLETLAIIAYKQPVTKSQIEEIRGVNSDHAVNKLIEYDLVIEKGRLDSPGKPIIFGTSEEFLKYFGFKSISQLPKFFS